MMDVKVKIYSCHLEVKSRSTEQELYIDLKVGLAVRTFEISIYFRLRKPKLKYFLRCALTIFQSVTPHFMMSNAEQHKMADHPVASLEEQFKSGPTVGESAVDITAKTEQHDGQHDRKRKRGNEPIRHGHGGKRRDLGRTEWQ